MSSLQCPTADLRQNSENTISQRDKKAVIYSCRDFKEQQKFKQHKSPNAHNDFISCSTTIQ